MDATRSRNLIRLRVLGWMREYVPSLLSDQLIEEANRYRPERESILKSLEPYPPGTLGAEYRSFFLEHGIDVPGEGNSVIPEWYAYHDVLHLLCEYEPTGKGELELAAFTAGFSHLGWISVLKTVLMFQYGLPLVRGVPPSFGVARYQDLRQAYLRGKRVNTNLMTWDFRAHWHVPIEELKKELNILPKNEV